MLIQPTTPTLALPLHGGGNKLQTAVISKNIHKIKAWFVVGIHARFYKKAFIDKT